MYQRTVAEEEADPGQTMRGVVGGTQLFKRFTLQKILGRGGMGIVWLARDDRLDRLVALKLVSEAVCFDPSAHEDLKRETRKSLLLTHPNIVRIFDFIEEEGNAAISMEYVDGATLSYLRVQKPSKCFEVREIAPWVTSLCGALTYAHESVGLVHRDLKPANIMVNSRSELKITDFGIACSLRDSMSLVSMRTSSGTLNYMSPQQMLGEDPSPADDIYALGATLYEMLTTKPPFFGGDVASQVREVTAPTLAERRAKLGVVGEPIPKHWEETIAACLAKTREQRPQTAVDVARRLQQSETIQIAETTKPPSQPYHRIAALVIGGLAALVTTSLVTHSCSKAPTATAAPARKRAPTGFAMETPTAVHAKPELLAQVAVSPLAQGIEPPKARLQLITTPPGATFAIYPGVIASKTAPANAPLHSGTAPESIDDLAPGRYTVFFHHKGWPDDRAEISLQSGETLPVDYDFPHGSATITSTPDGAEIFVGEKSLGRTPITIDLPPGKQELVATHPDFPKRSETVMIENGVTAKVAFKFLRARSRSSSKPKPKPTPESAWNKLGDSIKNAFRAKPTPPPKKSSRKRQ
jgi:serine/threonine protein kinase